MLGVHAIAALNVSEHVVVRVYSIFVIAVDIDTVCESDPLAEVNEPVIVHDDVVELELEEETVSVKVNAPLKVAEAVPAVLLAVSV